MAPASVSDTSTTLACSMTAPLAAAESVSKAFAPLCPEERISYIALVSGPDSTPVATETLRIPLLRVAKLSVTSPAPVLRRTTACWKSAANLSEATATATSPATSSPAPMVARLRKRSCVASEAADTPSSLPSAASAPRTVTCPTIWLPKIMAHSFLRWPPGDNLLRLALRAQIRKRLVCPPDRLLGQHPRRHVAVFGRLEERVIGRTLPHLALGRQPAPQLCPFR